MSLFLQRLSNSILNILQNIFINREDLFNNLPPEIIIEILSRLPTKTIQSCKRVCKSWRDLVERPDFATSLLSKPTPTSCLAFSQICTLLIPYQIFRFVEEQFAAKSLPLSNNWPSSKNPTLYSSANGLLFLLKASAFSDNLFICNPITREYIELQLPHHREGRPPPDKRIFGFGVTKISGQYKVIILEDSSLRTRIPRHTCEVYTLGTGHWRRIAACSQFAYNYGDVGVFVNGNLHWLVFDSDHNPSVLCLDLETELFTSFSPPIDFPHDYNGYRHRYPSLFALGDRLCLYTTSYEFVMWSMKDYGDEKSWTKKIIITIRPYSCILPVKVLEDGEILFFEGGFGGLLCYSKKTKTIRKCSLGGCGYFRDNVVSYTPSFKSLKTLKMENVVSFGC